MGWDNFHSIWDEPVDDRLVDPEEKEADKKKTPRKKKLSWWEEFNDDSDSGREEARKYSYDDAFDDTAPVWYRQSGFGYSRYSDYSPSRLFRSSFSSTFTSYSGDNEAKNKAIRALRTLTRNANTVANATAKIQYNVQFSSGADSNGVTAEITTGKQQSIYVCPDDVVRSKDADEEDAAVDALTGFVLLRVQLTQSVDANTICEINACGVRSMPKYVAQLVQNVASGATVSADGAAAELVDSYFAGMLAKSMLTRLCRKAVVKDWSGFAPYFVRHAKKFLTAKEKIEALSPSVEGFATKIAYNLVAAEDEIAVIPEIAKIVDEHLGEKLDAAKILPACQNLIAKIREWFASQAENTPGAIESALAAAIEKVASRGDGKSSATEEQEMHAGLDEFAGAMDDLFREENDSAPRLAEFQNGLNASREIVDEITNALYKEKFVNGLKNSLKTLKAMIAESHTDASRSAANDYMAETIKSQLEHFRQQVLDLTKAVPEADKVPAPNLKELIKEAADPLSATVSMRQELEKFTKQFAPVIKDEITELRKKLHERATKYAELCTAEIAATQKMLEKHIAARETLTELNGKFGSAGAAIDISNKIISVLAAHKLSQETMQRSLTTAAASAVRSATGNRSEAREIDGVLDKMRVSGATLALNTIRWSFNGSRGQSHKFVGAATSAYEAATNAQEEYGTDDERVENAINAWHKPAIDEFLATDELSAGQFIAMAMREVNKEMFDALTKAFNNEMGEVPIITAGMTPEKFEKLQNAAASLGMSPQALLDMLRAADKAQTAGKNCSDATRAGDIINQVFNRDVQELSPIDEQLFGETVQKKTTVLDGAAIDTVNQEAKDAVEEEYVAYLSDTNARPKMRVTRKSTKTASPYTQKIAAEVIQRNRGAIDKIRNALQFQNNKRTGEVYGTLSGDLDEGSLHKLRYDSEHIWSQKTITKLPDVAVGLLVDQSGSMSGPKINQAREMCILLAEAIKRIKGVHLHIYGHTANRGGSTDLELFEHFSSVNSAENAHLGHLGDITAYSNNYDGYAIKETAKLLNQDPAKRKYMFVISDGLPHGCGYAGEDARKHVTSVCTFVRSRLKIATYAFAVGVPPSEKAHFEEQYGANNVIFLSKVSACLPQIVRFLRNALQKEKTLVNAAVD
jgi:soluble cytochrome b562